jgi:ATP-dependent RNA helicase RhlE
VDSEEIGYLKDIERLIKLSIVRVAVEGFTPPVASALMSEERPPRPPYGRGAPRSGANNRTGGSRDGSNGNVRTGHSRPATSSKPQAQAVPTFTPKPGARGR